MSAEFEPHQERRSQVLTISVRRKFVPLKQSRKDPPTFNLRSSAMVCCIMARRWSLLTIPEGALTRRSSVFLASSIRPLRTSHQGLSGENQVAKINTGGHIHWSANGTLKDHSDCTGNMPRRTPVARIRPMTQQRLTYVVRYPLSAIGTISAAYVGVAAAKRPQVHALRLLELSRHHFWVPSNTITTRLQTVSQRSAL